MNCGKLAGKSIYGHLLNFLYTVLATCLLSRFLLGVWALLSGIGWIYFHIKFHHRYRNYPPEQLVDLVARVLALVPPWTRVYRIQRDIPMPLVTSGVEKGNLRELALARMDDLGLKCRDVRTREAGIQVCFMFTNYSLYWPSTFLL